MAFKVAYFTPTIVAADQVPPVEFSKLFNLAEELYSHPELHEGEHPFVSVRGGQHIQIHPARVELDVAWLITWLEKVAQDYMDVITEQSGSQDLKLCKPVITNIWTTRQYEGDYHEMHTHLGSNISGNIYISSPDLATASNTSDGKFVLKLPQTKDISRFVMQDSWQTDAAPGTFVVFPSCLSHTVYPWKGNGHRTVVSFEASLTPIKEEDEE
jgi:Putative 2OG-Fe(II) oxygenase